MKEKQVKLPGPDHPISIQRNPARVVVSVAGRVVADTRNALTLREAAYPPVQYIPGQANQLKMMNRLVPGFILKQMSRSVDRMLRTQN